ncbi:hypothetical protein CVV67_02675 [Arthrobacter stackebrandtii]|nr:hypothetical protein CVV67_02675 [Arthrobacter stackebrandtii]
MPVPDHDRSPEDTGFAMTRVFQEHNAPRATNLGGRLLQMGIYGDVHLLQSGVVANGLLREDLRCADCNIPVGAPPCIGVRRGSTQPCRLWIWRRDATLIPGTDWLDPSY